MSDRQIVERFVKGLISRNLDLQAEVCAEDMVIEYPQSGERIRGWANIRAVAENYPGGLPQDLAANVSRRVAVGQDREDDRCLWSPLRPSSLAGEVGGARYLDSTVIRASHRQHRTTAAGKL